MEEKSNFLTHKILPLFAIFLFCLFINTTVFATITVENPYTSETVNLPDIPTAIENKYFVCFASNQTGYAISLLYFDSPKSLSMTGSAYSSYGSDFLITIPNGGKYYKYNVDTKVWDLTTENRAGGWEVGGFNINWRKIIFSNYDVYRDGTLAHKENYLSLTTVVMPSLVNIDDIQTNPDFQKFYINSNGLNETFYFYVRKDYYPIPDSDVNYGTTIKYEINPEKATNFEYDENGNKYFYISKDIEGFSYNVNDSYSFWFERIIGNKSFYSDVTNVIIGEQTSEQIQSSMNNKLNDLNETNKGIFEQIGEVLSYINPFSENFFVYKLIELLVEALKGLFIPEEGYFDNYFTELQDWFSERLGFLYYPLDILFTLFDRFMELGNGSLSINIPEIKEPFTGVTLISPNVLDFNAILGESTFGTIHNIYLLIVDASVYIGLVVLLYRKYEGVISK